MVPSTIPRLVALRVDDYVVWEREVRSIFRLDLPYARAALLLAVSLRTTQRWAKELACQPGQGRRGGKGSAKRNRAIEVEATAKRAIEVEATAMANGEKTPRSLPSLAFSAPFGKRVLLVGSSR